MAGETNTANNAKSAAVAVLLPVHIGDLDATSTNLAKGQWKAQVTARVHDSGHNPVAGATVAGKFTQGGWTKLVSCVTDAAGACTADSGAFPSKATTASYSVTNVSYGSALYQSSANHDPETDSNGTTIGLVK